MGEKYKESWQTASPPRKYQIQLVAYRISTKFQRAENPNVILTILNIKIEEN